MAASDNLGPLQPPRIDNGIRSRMLFQGEAAANFSLTGGDHIAPRKLQFIVDNADRDRFIRSQHVSQSRSWNLGGGSRSDGSDDDNDDYDEEEDDLDEGDGLESLEDNSNIKNGNNSSGSVQSSSEKVNGLSRGIVVRNGNLSEQQHGGVSNYDNALTLVEPAMYCGQILMNERDGLGSVQNGFGGRKEEVDHEESLREHLLDPITGILMDDAMILPCGHSFGSGGMQNVFRMKACCRCSRPISENLVRPNLALRSAVQAFRREEGAKTLKRRDRVEQDKCNYDLCSMELRGKGVQFPFVVSDRVIIKGNKRTPPRFVGRVAVVTTQCLNGWYVVKTLDNAESVKLQYRSLEKVADDSPPNVNI